MQCVNKNTREYQTLLKLSGLSDFELSIYVGKSLDTLGRYPYLDELPNADSSKAISEDLKLNKDNTTKTENILQATNVSTVEEAVPLLNNKYRDKEIEVLEVGSGSKVYITTRPNTIQNQDGETDKLIKVATEMANIKKRALANGTFMLAPNGKPTNLTEQQWLQVRTLEFKDWFGDWENDPKNASKVVDENGEPLAVYHDGAYNINIFKGDSFGLSYFGDSMTAATYGGSEATVFLNIKNPEIVEGEGEEIGEVTERKYGTKRISPPKGKDGVIYKNVKDIGEGIYEWDYEDSDRFWIEYEKQGYGTVYSIPSANQIKSATNNNGLFSSSNNNINDDYENVNSFAFFNEIIDKLQTLYGINIIPINNAELSKDRWASITGSKGVKAFIYNGNIYINTDIATVDSPVHEFLHLLFGSMKYLNRALYDLLVNLAEQFDSYNAISLNYPNRTKGDINEEVFVTELARYLTGLSNAIDNLSDAIKSEIMYNINRTLDTVLMGENSVRCVLNPYSFSLKSLALLVNSSTMISEKRGSLDDATLNRMLANTKSDLMRNKELREECQ